MAVLENEPNDDKPNRAADPGKRIAAFVQAHQHSRPKQVAEEDVQKLQTATGKLDQLLKKVAQDAQTRSRHATDNDVHTLKAAAARLDDLLAGRGSGR